MFSRTFLLVALLNLILAAPLKSQDSKDEYRRHWVMGYMAPGFTNDPGNAATWNAGGGYERLVASRLGIRGEAGVLFAGVKGGDAGFPLSINGSVYFKETPPNQRIVVPYITGGYTRGGVSRSVNMINFGVGINQWTANRGAFRFEVNPAIAVERTSVRRPYFVIFRFAVLGELR